MGEVRTVLFTDEDGEPVYEDDLIDQYKDDIESWDWDKIKSTALQFVEKEEDDYIGRAWLGTVFGLTPSGKVYTFWTSNQTEDDVLKDEIWWDVLAEVAQKYDMFIFNGEGDPCDVFAGIIVDQPEEEEE